MSNAPCTFVCRFRPGQMVSHVVIRYTDDESTSIVECGQIRLVKFLLGGSVTYDVIWSNGDCSEHFEAELVECTQQR